MNSSHRSLSTRGSLVVVRVALTVSLIVTIPASLLAWVTPAGAQDLADVEAVEADRPEYSSRRIVSHGYYAEVGGGAALFLGDAADYSEVGLSFELRTGYDLFSWLSLGVSLAASTHEATVPPPPVGEYYQLYGGTGDLRLGFLLGPIGLFADGGVGVAMMSSNILEQVDILEPGEKFSLLVRAGGGLEYQLRNRHYALGLAGQWVLMPQYDASQGVTTRLYLRYTY